MCCLRDVDLPLKAIDSVELSQRKASEGALLTVTSACRFMLKTVRYLRAELVSRL